MTRKWIVPRMYLELPCPGILLRSVSVWREEVFPLSCIYGRVWPLSIYVWPSVAFYFETLCAPVWPPYLCWDWPLVALNTYRYAVLYDGCLLNYFISSVSEVNMSCRLIFS